MLICMLFFSSLVFLFVEWCYIVMFFKLLVMGLCFLLLLDFWFYTNTFVHVYVCYFYYWSWILIFTIRFCDSKLGFSFHTRYPDSTVLRISTLLVVFTLLLYRMHVLQFACFISQVCSVVDSAELCRHTHPDRFSSCYHYYYYYLSFFPDRIVLILNIYNSL